MILAILFSPSNRDEWMVYLLSEQPATGMANKFLSHETGTGRAIAMLWDVCVCVYVWVGGGGHSALYSTQCPSK